MPKFLTLSLDMNYEMVQWDGGCSSSISGGSTGGGSGSAGFFIEIFSNITGITTMINKMFKMLESDNLTF